MAQGHVLMHFIFFVSMFFIDKDITINLQKSAEIKAEPEATLLSQQF